MRLEGKQIGFVIALVLACIMLFLPSQNSSKYSFDPEAIAKSIDAQEDQIDPRTLSEWIIEGRRDFQVIDIRSEKEFEESSIKGAENIPLQELLRKDTIEGLSEDKLVVIYSNGNSHAGQAWLVLNTAGIDAYVLEGGLNYWNSFIMNPKAPSGAPSDDEILRFRARKAVGNYLGGGSSVVSTPADDIPKSKKKIIKKPRKKKKKLKGC